MPTTASATALTIAPPRTTNRSRGLRRRNVLESEGEAFISLVGDLRAVHRREKVDVLEVVRGTEAGQNCRRVRPRCPPRPRPDATAWRAPSGAPTPVRL